MTPAEEKETAARLPENPTRDEMNLRLRAILDIGELLLESGAEVNRVEDTIQRLCHAYGFGRTDVFTITSSIVVTAMIDDGYPCTQTRRIYSVETDLGLMERINDFSRKLCRAPLPPEEIEKELIRFRVSSRQNPVLRAACYAGISAVFAAFFGGSPADALAASVSGLALFAALEVTGRMHMNGIFQRMGCSALTALVVILLVKCGLGNNPDRIMMGNIMLVIPGVQFTTALRDMMNGDNVNGTLNLAEAVMKAIAVATGFAFVQNYFA